VQRLAYLCWEAACKWRSRAAPLTAHGLSRISSARAVGHVFLPIVLSHLLKECGTARRPDPALGSFADWAYPHAAKGVFNQYHAALMGSSKAFANRCVNRGFRRQG